MITKSEIKKQLGVVLIAVGAFLVAYDAKEYINEITPWSNWFNGLIIIAISLYFLKLNGN